MKNLITFLLGVILIFQPAGPGVLWAANKDKDEGRLKDCGTVLKEILLVMSQGGARGILSGKVKLGGDASVAAGPVGRDASAETDVTLRSEILSYSRSRVPVCWHLPGRFNYPTS